MNFPPGYFRHYYVGRGQGLLVLVSGMASLTAQQHSQHLAVAVLGSCYSAQPRRLLMLPRREARSDDGCAVALPLLTCITEMATPSQNTSSLHLKDTQMEIITKAYHRCKCGEYLNPGAPRSQHICNTNPEPTAQETLEKRNGKIVRAGEPGRRSATRQCLLHMTRSYAHEI